MTKRGTGGRPRVGSTYEKHGVRVVAVTTDRPGAPKPRWVKRCPVGDDGAPLTETDARLLAAKLQRAYDRAEWDPWALAPEQPTADATTGLETTARWCDRWCDAREAAGLHSVKDDRARLRLHVLPLIGEVPVSRVTPAQLEDVRDALDAKARSGEIAPATALKAWGLVTKMFTDAKASKTRALRVRTDNPALDLEPPDRGGERAGTFLYPSELFTLVTCERVPLHWRRLFAVAAFTGLRAGELEALEWDAIDLERGIIHVHQAADRETAEVRETKTGIARRFALERGILPMLRAMHREAGGRGRVIPKMPDREDGAAYLRTCLGYAGIARAELFARTKTQRPIVFHDLRASFLTWCAVRGDEPLRIQQRAGHTTFSTTQRYVRAAENLRGEGFGALFPELPALASAPVPAGGSATESATAERRGARNPKSSEPFHGDPNGIRRRPDESCRPAEYGNVHEAGAASEPGEPLRTPAEGSATGSATAVAGALEGPELAAQPDLVAHLAQSEASALAMLSWLGASGQPGGEA